MKKIIYKKKTARILREKIRDKNEITFFEKVYEVVRLIPKGRVTSYGAIARYLGAARSSRMVGWAMNNAHAVHPPVPAQRVVNRNGLLTGKHHFGDPEAMELLLRKDGVMVKADKVVDFEKIFWDPSVELEL
jgi:methylated-DNA-protein-cysteine methyltransferase-like protein